jgi:hypothetical protein
MMNEDIASMREALASLARAPALKASFGIERITMRSDLWHERLAIAGTGRVTLSTLRSFGDASGEDIGRYQGQLAEPDVDGLLRAVEASVGGGPAAPLSPGDVRVLVTLVACGAKLVHVIGGGPEHLAPYSELLAALDRTAFAVRRRPACTLRLGAEIPDVIDASDSGVPVVLTFANAGSEGAWLRNPASGMDDTTTEHVRLWYAPLPVEEPGVTALPMEPEPAPLVPALHVQRPLLWLGACESESRPFSASLALPPGRYLMRASFSSYAGTDTVAGQNLLRGCVFSPEQTVEVRG